MKSKILRVLTGLILVAMVHASSGQSSFKRNKSFFQRNQRAMTKIRYQKKSKRYGKACEIFEKKRTKGEKPPLLSFLGIKRKKRPELAEQP